MKKNNLYDLLIDPVERMLDLHRLQEVNKNKGGMCKRCAKKVKALDSEQGNMYYKLCISCSDKVFCDGLEASNIEFRNYRRFKP